jgi:hypothetical protein
VTISSAGSADQAIVKSSCTLQSETRSLVLTAATHQE